MSGVRLETFSQQLLLLRVVDHIRKMELNWIVFTLCISLILIQGESSFATSEIQSDPAPGREVERCGSYVYKVVKPLLNYIELLKTNNDNKTSILNGEIEELREKLSDHKVTLAVIRELRDQLDLYRKNNDSLQSIKIELNKLNSQKCEEIQIDNDKIDLQLRNHLEEHRKIIDQNKQEISKLQNDVEESETKLKDLNRKSSLIGCSSLGDAQGVHRISFSNYSFDVLCDSETAGPGWTVIQQRIRGREDFNRTWAEYRAGFGSFDGDFFLGLEKIHRLTSHKPQELYIHLEAFDGFIRYARYYKFVIAGESDKYRLSLSGFSGNTSDWMSDFNNNEQFSTHDCGLECYGGWWYNEYYRLIKLNGKYYENSQDWTSQGILWRYPVKNVKMLIRPAVI